MKKIWAYLLHLGTNMWGAPEDEWKYSMWSDTVRVDEHVWREIIDFLPTQGFNTVVIDVADAIQYETHPEISLKDAWSKDKLKKELDYMRSIGLTPIPKLNFSSGHDAWLKQYSRMLSTPIYYQVCEDLIKEVAELFGYPEYFHLGMDEETAHAQRRAQFCCIRQGDLWWHDLYFYFDVCEKVGARPWVFACYCWRNSMETFLKKMPKAPLLTNTDYSPITKNPDGTYKNEWTRAFVTLDEAGYDQVPGSSTYKNWYCSLELMQMSKESIAPERLYGHWAMPWQYTQEYARYILLNEALQFGNAKKEIYPND